MQSAYLAGGLHNVCPGWGRARFEGRGEGEKRPLDGLGPDWLEVFFFFFFSFCVICSSLFLFLLSTWVGWLVGGGGGPDHVISDIRDACMH